MSKEMDAEKKNPHSSSIFIKRKNKTTKINSTETSRKIEETQSGSEETGKDDETKSRHRKLKHHPN